MLMLGRRSDALSDQEMNSRKPMGCDVALFLLISSSLIIFLCRHSMKWNFESGVWNISRDMKVLPSEGYVLGTVHIIGPPRVFLRIANAVT